jgi:integrase
MIRDIGLWGEDMVSKNQAKGDSKKRGRGEGTISYRKNEKRYEGRYVVQTSRGPRRKVVYGKDFDEARRKLNAAIKDRDDGLVFDAEEMTLAEYLRSWLKGPAKRNVRPSTFARYEQLSRKHLIPALGSVRLKRLTALHLENLYEDKLDEGLSPRTVNYIHTTVSKALRHAVAKDLLRRNVASFAEAPQPKTPEMLTLNREEVRFFLDAARGNRLEALYILALATGMRRSELLGLRWGDLDLEAGVLLVRRGLTISPGGGVEIEDPKRFSSRRRLEISPKVATVLKEHRGRQAEERLAAGPGGWQDEGFVFASRSGGFIHPNTLYTAYFKKLRDRAGVPPIHFHDLRHTYATQALLLPNAKIKVVSETLGHKDIATTLRIYAHVLPGMQREAAEAMDSVLF